MNRGRAIAGGLRLISRALERLAGEIEVSNPVFFAGQPTLARIPTESAKLSPTLKIVAEAEYRLRRDRERHISADLLGEPGWDILLALFIAHHEDREMQVSAVCSASAAPMTTALRWLAHLEDCGFLVKQQHRMDARSRHVALTREGVLAVGGCLLNQELSAELAELAGMMQLTER